MTYYDDLADYRNKKDCEEKHNPAVDNLVGKTIQVYGYDLEPYEYYTNSLSNVYVNDVKASTNITNVYIKCNEVLYKISMYTELSYDFFEYNIGYCNVSKVECFPDTFFKSKIIENIILSKEQLQYYNDTPDIICCDYFEYSYDGGDEYYPYGHVKINKDMFDH